MIYSSSSSEDYEDEDEENNGSADESQEFGVESIKENVISEFIAEASPTRPRKSPVVTVPTPPEATKATGPAKGGKKGSRKK